MKMPLDYEKKNWLKTTSPTIKESIAMWIALVGVAIMLALAVIGLLM